MNLLNDDNDSDDESTFKINKDYASRYDKWRQGEELQKLKDKYGDVNEDDSQSTSSEEDEDAVELTEDIEKKFFKTLAYLKKKDPKIYDESTRFFEKKSADDSSPRKVEKRTKPETVSVAAYHRKMLLEPNDDTAVEPSPSFDDLPLVEQEKALRESFKDALKQSDDEDEGMGGLFAPRTRTADEVKKEEDDYRQWLAGQEVKVDADDASELKGLREYWTDPNLNEGEKFLRDYILNHRYLEKDDREVNDEAMSESEDEVDQQEEFEHKYNFRFEEPDQDFIRRYPRTVEQSMRKKDDKRKRHREEVKARKLGERAKKNEELKRLKALKRAEILEKIKKLQEVTGNQTMGFEDKDVEGEFDPAEHDKRMSELFTDEFYGANVDEEKPVFNDSDEELEIENWDDYVPANAGGNANDELHCEDPGFVMDCDFDPTSSTQREMITNSKRRKKRRQSQFAAAAAQTKPVFDPKNKTLSEYMDEYYALDYEDLIDGIPCRFKYRKVVPNDFGLSIEEILAAPDKELNRWASVKKIMRRRAEHAELNEVNTYKRMAHDVQRKMKLIPSLFTPPEEPEPAGDEEVSSSKRRKRPQSAEEISNIPNDEANNKNENSNTDDYPPLKKKRKKKKKMKLSVVSDSPQVTETSPTKKLSVVSDTSQVSETLSPKSIGEKKKKKKKKKLNKKVKVENDSSTTMELKSEKSKKKDRIEESPSILITNSTKLQSKKSGKKKKNTEKVVNEPVEIVKPKGKTRNKGPKKVPQSTSTENPLLALSDARLKSYGLNPKKFRNKLKYTDKN